MVIYSWDSYFQEPRSAWAQLRGRFERPITNIWIFKREACAPIHIQIHILRAARTHQFVLSEISRFICRSALDSLSSLDHAHTKTRDGMEYRVYVCARIRDTTSHIFRALTPTGRWWFIFVSWLGCGRHNVAFACVTSKDMPYYRTICA